MVIGNALGSNTAACDWQTIDHAYFYFHLGLCSALKLITWKLITWKTSCHYVIHVETWQSPGIKKTKKWQYLGMGLRYKIYITHIGTMC